MLAYKLTVLLIIEITGLREQDIEFPENTVAVAGDTAQLNCKYYSSRCSNIRWQKRLVYGHVTDISVGNRVYYGNKYQLNDSSICTLIVKNVQISDSGTFICTNADSFGFGELIVIQTKPPCSSSCRKESTVENEKVNFKCQLAYIGDARPVMNWWNKRTRSEIKGIPDQRQGIASVSRDFSWNAAAPGIDSLICLTKFYFDQTPRRANNVPEVLCETDDCYILYSVRNVGTKPQEFASPGEKITCSAFGNPNPTFEWQWKEDGEDGEWEVVYDETSETIEAFLNNGTSTKLRCVAKNTVNGVEHSQKSRIEDIEERRCHSPGIIVGVVVGLVILVIIVAVVDL